MSFLRTTTLRLAVCALAVLPLAAQAASGDNSATASVNLALLSSANVTGTAPPGGRGAPGDILFDPATGDYAVRTAWNEYGVAYNQNLGMVGEGAAFTWQVTWPTAKNINYITIGGCYPNQPQPNTRWKVQRRLGSTWTTISEGTGGWINNGIYSWGGATQPAVVADAIRLLAYSDGTNNLVSIHLRGRGGQSNSIDDRSQGIKATLIQYLPVVAPPPPPPGAPLIILDTDIGPDVDDAGAVAVLHALADAGECTILGMMVSARGSTETWGAPCLDAMNTFYGRPDIPIGVNRRAAPAFGSRYNYEVAQEFPQDLGTGANAWDTVDLYRKLLSEQANGSVTIVSIGFLSNLEDLLRSGPDQWSALNGKDLVAQKVRLWSCMGGRFPSGSEFNFNRHASASQYVVQEWPTRAVFSGYEIGSTIYTGFGLRSVPSPNPIKRAYERYNGLNNRQSWDQTAVLYAVRGAQDYWLLNETGSCVVASTGSNTWSSTDRNHAYLMPLMSTAGLVQIIEELMTRPPAYEPPPVDPNQSIVREFWTGVTGTSVAAIPVQTAPSGTDILTSLEGPVNWGDNYGTRIRGYIIPPTTGSYTFWIAGDDHCELWLSSGMNPGQKTLIANVTGWAGSRDWNKYASQKSAAITLTAGQRYYVEVLHKEGTGGDNVAVGWLKPGQTGTAPSEVVPGSALAQYDAAAVVTLDVTSVILRGVTTGDALTVAGQPVTIAADGTWEASVTMPGEAEVLVEVVAEGAGGTAVRQVALDELAVPVGAN